LTTSHSSAKLGSPSGQERLEEAESGERYGKNYRH
jgi:hypothetical protein